MTAKEVIPQVHDCWNRIGVWSKRKPSCPELERVVHCRNCEVYHAASQMVFERKPPEGYQRDWAQLLAQQKAALSTGDQAVLVFRIQREWMALPTAAFQDVAVWRVVRQIPHMHGDVLQGLVNIDGRIEPCFSLAAVLGGRTEVLQDVGQAGVYARFLVMAHEDKRYVFAVSEVGGLHRYHATHLQDVPSTVPEAMASHAHGIFLWSEQEVVCLDLARIVRAFEQGFG